MLAECSGLREIYLTFDVYDTLDQRAASQSQTVENFLTTHLLCFIPYLILNK